LGSKEQGARSKERGARSGERGAGSREQGARSKEQGARSKEQGAGSREQGAGSRERLREIGIKRVPSSHGGLWKCDRATSQRRSCFLDQENVWSRDRKSLFPGFAAPGWGRAIRQADREGRSTCRPPQAPALAHLCCAQILRLPALSKGFEDPLNFFARLPTPVSVTLMLIVPFALAVTMIPGRASARGRELFSPSN